jgi:hypothetical protein
MKEQEQELMTIDELIEFFNHLCFSECSWEYVTRGLAFFLHTLEVRINTDDLDARDWLNKLASRLFSDVSEQGRDAQIKFTEDSVKYFKGLNETKNKRKQKPKFPTF